MRIHIALIGFGNVARRFVRLLDESRDALDALDIEPVIVGIATRRHGAVFDAAGLDAHTRSRLADLAAEGDASESDRTEGRTARRRKREFEYHRKSRARAAALSLIRHRRPSPRSVMRACGTAIENRHRSAHSG